MNGSRGRIPHAVARCRHGGRHTGRVAGQTGRSGQARRYRRRRRDAEGRNRGRNLRDRPDRAASRESRCKSAGRNSRLRAFYPTSKRQPALPAAPMPVSPDRSSQRPSGSPTHRTAGASAPGSPRAPPTAAAGRVRASPAARRLAEMKGVDLGAIARPWTRRRNHLCGC